MNCYLKRDFQFTISSTCEGGHSVAAELAYRTEKLETALKLGFIRNADDVLGGMSSHLLISLRISELPDRNQCVYMPVKST